MGSKLTLLFLSFAYTMVSLSVPDHFGLSTTALLLTLYVTGRNLQRGRQLTKLQTVLLFLLTAGISLNNGIKVFLASWGTSGKRFFRPAHLLLAVIVPSALIWGFARWEWQTFEKPKYLARQEKATAAPHPDAGEEEEDDEGLDGIARRIAVGDDDGAIDEHVAQHMVGVELYGLAKQVFDDALQARGRGVGPRREFPLSHWLALVGIVWL